MAEIDGQRLLNSLRELATYGKAGTGVNRTAFTPQDLEARRWLVQEMSAAGLDAGMDRYGNVYGRSPGAEQALLIGSHTDTVPMGGWLDGALGVIYGLEIVRTLRKLDLPITIDIISFQDEEGTFVPCLGAKSYCGALEQGDVAKAVAADGRVLSDEFKKADLPEVTFSLDRSRHLAFLEAHIEQGPRLEASGSAIGVVTGIVGIRRYRVTATGQADHAGTTPLSMRRDAGAALISLADRLLREMPRLAGAESVWNIGKFELKPGAANVVPAEAMFILEFRDIDESRIAAMEKGVGDIIAEAASQSAATIKSELIGRVEPVVMDGRLQELLKTAGQRRDGAPLTMPSGAGHDAMVLAQRIPTAMVFIPSIGGRSHDISENTSDEDIVKGCQIMADAVVEFCSAQLKA